MRYSDGVMPVNALNLRIKQLKAFKADSKGYIHNTHVRAEQQRAGTLYAKMMKIFKQRAPKAAA